MTIIQQPSAEAGRAIAREYWLKTNHVFSRRSPNAIECALCETPEYVPGHIPATPRPEPKIVRVLESGRNRHSFDLFPDCGHASRLWQTFDGRKHPPRVGDATECSECYWTWHDVNFPGLPVEIMERISAAIPRCPQCGEPPDIIPYVEHCAFDIQFDTDGQTGEINAQADHKDTLDVEPVWDSPPVPLPGYWESGLITVECENHHSFQTDRLEHNRTESDHIWRVRA